MRYKRLSTLLDVVLTNVVIVGGLLFYLAFLRR